MKKFQLTAVVGNLVVYQALYILTKARYQAFLDVYRRDGARSIGHLTGIVEELTGGKPFDENETDYITDAPDAIVAALICMRVNLFQTWTSFSILEPDEAETKVEIDLTSDFDFSCVPIE